MSRFIAFAVGFAFALGLGISGMTRPEKVIGFLDFFGAWDPSLALVMVGAIGVHLTFLRLTRRQARPVCAASFAARRHRGLDARLVAGAALFGLGWGLGGYCPGPALVSSVSSGGAAVLVLAMLLGVLLHEWQERLVARGTDPEPQATRDPAQ